MSSGIGNFGVEGDPQARGNLLRLKPPLNRVMLGLGFVVKSYLTLATPWTIQPTRFFCPWDFPGTVGCH